MRHKWIKMEKCKQTPHLKHYFCINCGLERARPEIHFWNAYNPIHYFRADYTGKIFKEYGYKDPGCQGSKLWKVEDLEELEPYDFVKEELNGKS